MGVKNAELDADIESFQKFAEHLKRKKLPMKSDRKMDFLTFITEC
jgi:hypothetical protein